MRGRKVKRWVCLDTQLEPWQRQRVDIHLKAYRRLYNASLRAEREFLYRGKMPRLGDVLPWVKAEALEIGFDSIYDKSLVYSASKDSLSRLRAYKTRLRYRRADECFFRPMRLGKKPSYLSDGPFDLKRQYVFIPGLDWVLVCGRVESLPDGVRIKQIRVHRHRIDLFLKGEIHPKPFVSKVIRRPKR